VPPIHSLNPDTTNIGWHFHNVGVCRQAQEARLKLSVNQTTWPWLGPCVDQLLVALQHSLSRLCHPTLDLSVQTPPTSGGTSTFVGVCRQAQEAHLKLFFNQTTWPWLGPWVMSFVLLSNTACSGCATPRIMHSHGVLILYAPRVLDGPGDPFARIIRYPDSTLGRIQHHSEMHI
jgi:hypothetical protein